MKKMKRILASAGATIVLLTGCSSVGNMDFTQYAVNQLEIKSLESNGVTTFHLKYDEKKVKDEKALKLLKLFSDIKITAHMISENDDTMSIEGTMTVKKGDIPFKLFLKQNEFILQLDNASKPIRIIDKSGSPTANTDHFVAAIKKLTPYIVKHLPNPSTLEVTSKQDKVMGENINGKNVHVEIYGDEIPSLILSFMEGISKDKEAIEILVNAINQADDSVKLTTQSFKNELDTMVVKLKEQLPTLKQDKTFQQVFSKNNYMKADILLDNKLHERKSNLTFHFAFPTPNVSGIESMEINTTAENWNINQSVKARNISAAQYLTDEQLADGKKGKAFLDTLNKDHSVLYDILVNDLKVNVDKEK
ncbi:hypothetical protein ACQCN2_08035 [Brevibacillus ginsengisoli]|uniref:hypothetical protein n=1 Tax=Brevibacillus ginsengisoli TaxID=363854 RepID=UPI003CE8158A